MNYFIHITWNYLENVLIFVVILFFFYFINIHNYVHWNAIHLSGNYALKNDNYNCGYHKIILNIFQSSIIINHFNCGALKIKCNDSHLSFTILFARDLILTILHSWLLRKRPHVHLLLSKQIFQPLMINKHFIKPDTNSDFKANIKAASSTSRIK